MPQKKQYLEFQEVDNTPLRTRRVEVVSLQSKGTLGVIHFYPQWRQYVFSPRYGTVWNHGCLDEIRGYLVRMNRERKESLARQR